MPDMIVVRLFEKNITNPTSVKVRSGKKLNMNHNTGNLNTTTRIILIQKTTFVFLNPIKNPDIADMSALKTNENCS